VTEKVNGLNSVEQFYEFDGSYWRCRVAIPLLGKGMNSLYRRHYRVLTKEKDAWLAMVAYHFQRRPIRPLKRCRITITRHSSGPAMDHDNLASTGKYLIDALKKHRIIEDDTPLIIGRPRFLQVKCAQKDQCTEVFIEELDHTREQHSCECKHCGQFI
jgi:hypothetical protein